MCDFAMDGLPKIRIEFAKSGRASCKNKNPKREDLKCFSCPGGEPKIAAGSLRCGVLNSDYNNYWQWKVSVSPACGLAPELAEPVGVADEVGDASASLPTRRGPTLAGTWLAAADVRLPPPQHLEW